MFGLYMGWRDIQDEWSTGLTREIVRTEMNMVRHIPNQYGVKYNDVLVLNFDIFHQDGSPFDYRESRLINNWLLKDTYKRFKVNDNNVDNVFYKAICTSIQDITIGDFCGKSITMTCDSPFAYTIERTKTVDTRETGSSTLKINNTSDDGIYYPYITIVCEEEYNKTIGICNVTENKEMVLDMSAISISEHSKIIYIDTEKMLLLDKNYSPIPLYKVGWTIEENTSKAIQTSELYWFRLLEGINEISIGGNAKVIFKLSFPRKAGQINEERNLSM